MTYGIGSVIGDIDQKVDTYRNKPEALAQMYQQNQQLIDLLALQKLKTEKEAAMRDMQMKMQTPAASIKDQREQEVMGMMRNEVAQQVAPGLQVAGQQAAQEAAPPAPEGGGLQSLPAPNMQGMGMAEGGIVAFGSGGKTRGEDIDNPVVGYRPDGTPITRADYERTMFALEQKAAPTAEDIERSAIYEALGKTPPPADATITAPRTSAGKRSVNRPVEEDLARDIYRGADNARESSISDLSDVIAASERSRSANRSPRYGENQARTQDEVAGLQALLSGGEGGGAPSTFDQGRVSHPSFAMRDRAHRRPYAGQDYVRLMENPDLALSEEDKQLEAAKRMGLIPDERAPTAPQAAPQAAPQPAPQAATQPAGIPTVGPQIDEDAAYRKSLERGLPQQAGIRAALPQNQTPPTMPTRDEADALMNVSSNAVKQAPPEVQNEYTRRLSELRGEQESKLEALIAFLQGAGGKTSFAATMAGGAAGMNAREQQIENEIMATVDKIEGLKLKQQEMGIEEDKVAAMREGNRLQAQTSRYNTDRDYAAAMARIAADNYNTLTDYQVAMAQEAASSAKAINDAIEKQHLTTAQRLELFASFDENLADDVRDALIEQIKEKGESAPDSPEGQKIIQDGLIAERNAYVLARISDVAQSYGDDPLYAAANQIVGE